MLPSVPRTLLRFEDACIQYANKNVLQQFSMEIQQGEFWYLVGRTGCGKSSLLRTLYADLPLSAGKVFFDNENITHIQRNQIPALRRKIGIVFQDFQLLPQKNIFDNILFALQATGWNISADAKKRVNEVLLQVGMMSKLQAMPHELSGGEQQRVAIARALINFPSLLIADEPTGNLDPESGDYIMELLREINRSGTTILMATHDYSLLATPPGRILHLTAGGAAVYDDTQRFLQSVSQRR